MQSTLNILILTFIVFTFKIYYYILMLIILMFSSTTRFIKMNVILQNLAGMSEPVK